MSTLKKWLCSDWYCVGEFILFLCGMYVMISGLTLFSLPFILMSAGFNSWLVWLPLFVGFIALSWDSTLLM